VKKEENLNKGQIKLMIIITKMKFFPTQEANINLKMHRIWILHFKIWQRGEKVKKEEFIFSMHRNFSLLLGFFSFSFYFHKCNLLNKL
jgi:hypothetical protein